MDVLDPMVVGFPPLARIVALTVGGLGGAALVCAAARRGLGSERARFWIGA